MSPKSISVACILAFSLCGSVAQGQCGSYCLADQNQDGMVTGADYAAWVTNYNNQDPLADVNQDGSVTAADFSAWVSEYNQGPNGTCCPGPVYMIVPCSSDIPVFTKEDLSACVGRYIEYGSDDRGFVTELAGDLPPGALTTVGTVACVDDCGTPNDPGDDPDVDPDGDVLESSMMLILASTCEPGVVGPTGCQYPPPRIDSPDYAVAVRLQRDGYSGMNPDKPRWKGTSRGTPVTVVYDGTPSGLMDPYYYRWTVTTSNSAYPPITCGPGCYYEFPGLHENKASHAGGDVSLIWECDNPDSPPDPDYAHYTVMEWALSSDVNGVEIAIHYGALLCAQD